MRIVMVSAQIVKYNNMIDFGRIEFVKKHEES